QPGSAKGVVFVTLEDETGIANLIVWPQVLETHRRVILGAGLLGACGRVQRDGPVIHLLAETLADLTPHLASLSRGQPTLRTESRDFR
ncbi:MAG: hypothetical protein H7841_18205, partial [Magnetospirillum sp. WYHS-4]